MPVPEARLQDIIVNKDTERALNWCSAYNYVESWSICDGALVIYDLDNPPAWFNFPRDEDGNSL